MPRPRTSGLNVVRKRRPDGSVESERYYDRRTKEYLGGDRAAALLRVQNREHEVLSSAHDRGSMSALITDYLSTEAYRRLAPGTRTLYRSYLETIRRDFGDMPVRGIRASMIERIKLSHAAQPRKANQIVALFRILLGLAVKRDMIAINPALRPGRLETPPRDQVWSHAQEAAFLAAARPALQLAAILLLYTVQRPGDVLAMTADRVSERAGRLFIRLKQAKTKELMDVPVHARLAPLLADRVAHLKVDGQPRGLIVASPTGLPWAYRNFARAWDADMQASGVVDRQRRDMRRTGIVRLAEAGATTPQIAALSGHSIDYCQRIIDTYLPRRTEVALGGIEAWERAPAGNVITLGRRAK